MDRRGFLKFLGLGTAAAAVAGKVEAAPLPATTNDDRVRPARLSEEAYEAFVKRCSELPNDKPLVIGWWEGEGHEPRIDLSDPLFRSAVERIEAEDYRFCSPELIYTVNAAHDGRVMTYSASQQIPLGTKLGMREDGVCEPFDNHKPEHVFVGYAVEYDWDPRRRL